MNQQPTAKEIADANYESSLAGSALWNARHAHYADRVLLRRRLDTACQRLNDLQDAARNAFATKHGWRYSAKQRINYNYPVLDHVDNFVDENGKRVARVTHSYAPFEDIERFAKANCLIAQRLPWSWWNPRPQDLYWRAYDCIAVLLMPTATNEALK